MGYKIPGNLNLTALGNGEELSRSRGSTPGSVFVQFATTPVMSSYLFATVVGRLEHASDETSDGKPVAVWSVPGKEGWLDFAVQVRIRRWTCAVLDRGKGGASLVNA